MYWISNSIRTAPCHIEGGHSSQAAVEEWEQRVLDRLAAWSAASGGVVALPMAGRSYKDEADRAINQVLLCMCCYLLL